MRKDIPPAARDLIVQYAAKHRVTPDQVLAKASPAVIAARSEAMAHLASLRDGAGVLLYTTTQLETWFGVGKAAISLARARAKARDAAG